MNILWRRRIIWLAMVILIITGLVYGFRPQPRLVEVFTATRGPLQVSVDEEGRTRVMDRYEITAPVRGTTCRVDMQVGDRVKKDQILINIKPLESAALDPRSRAQAESRVAAAEAALQAAEQTARSVKARMDLAEKELARLRPLYDEGHVSRGQLDQAETTLQTSQAVTRSARFSIDVALHELEAAHAVLDYSDVSGQDHTDANVQVRSPVEGRLLAIAQECEGVVAAGQMLMVVGDTRSLEVEVDVLSADAVRIKPGMRVEFHRWGGKDLLQGRVRTVEPVGFTKVSALGVEEQRVLVISDITSDPKLWQGLGDGYRVEAKFILWQSDDVLQVPASALFRSNGGWALFVMSNGKALRRDVSVGQRNGLHAQILQGLSEGESVITHPDNTIDDDVHVKQR